MWIVTKVLGVARLATPAVSGEVAAVVRRYSRGALKSNGKEMTPVEPPSTCITCEDAAGARWSGPADYSSVPTPRGTSTKPTAAQKKKMMEVNRDHNGGALRDDTTGEEMVPARKSVKGVTPPTNEVQVDHKIPESKGGTRDSRNLQLMTRANNREKWDKMPGEGSGPGVPPDSE